MTPLVAIQNTPPVIVTLVEKPTPQTTFADVILGSLGLTGVLVLIAAVLGIAMAIWLVKWNQRHPPGDAHLPSINTPAQKSGPS
jgi:ABC-type phosphate transport system permease subunit